MSSLRSALDELQVDQLKYRSDQELESDCVELEQAARMLEAERLRRLAEIDHRRSFERDGYLSTAAWAADRLGIAPATAAEQVRAGRALAVMPVTRGALSDGQLSASALRVLVSAHEANPTEFSNSESVLVDAAKSLPTRQFQQAVGYWRDAADSRSGLEQAERTWRRRRLHVSSTMFGMVRVDGDLDPEGGQTVITALRALQDAEARTSDPADARTRRQRRADALVEVCRQWLNRPDRPDVAGERPHVSVMVDLDALRGRAGKTCELDDVVPVHPEVARQLACDASISRVITRGHSEPLDVGRRTPVVPAPLRRAVVVRDRECRFPGCDRPPGWCDAHHVVHWAQGGPTALSNLVLLCRRHHRLVHHGFGVEMIDGKPLFRRPDGAILEGRAPP